MMRICFFLLLVFLISCNSKQSRTAGGAAADTTRSQASTWTVQGENEILDACIENAKQSLGEDTAYIYCKCVVNQVKQAYPNMDSASSVMSDSSRMAAYLKNCK